MAKAKPRSWWRMRQVRHRDAVALSVISAACLLAGETASQDIQTLYLQYLAPVESNPAVFLYNLVLVILAFTTTFGGILVLLGGLHFSWGRVGRGRFLVGLGIGLSALSFSSRVAYSLLTTGNPVAAAFPGKDGLTAVGIVVGVVSHTLMGQYALMLKKHAKRVWRRWRKAKTAPPPPAPRPSPATSSGRTARGARR
jgi:hypothetical protein